MSTLLEVAGLNVSFATRDGEVQAVRDLSFSLRAGEVLGIVGESGSGKTQAALALTGLLAENSRMSGSVLFEGQDRFALAEHERAHEGVFLAFQYPVEITGVTNSHC